MTGEQAPQPVMQPQAQFTGVTPMSPPQYSGVAAPQPAQPEPGYFPPKEGQGQFGGAIPPQQPAPVLQNPMQFQAVTPLPSLSNAPALVDCPACNQRAMTTASTEPGGTTHALAALLCFCCCLGCIPYCVGSLQDTVHRCGSCHITLAVCKQSGSTIVKVPEALQSAPAK